MKTAYDKLIEESVIEESYGTEFNKKVWDKMETITLNLLKDFNIMRT